MIGWRRQWAGVAGLVLGAVACNQIAGIREGTPRDESAVSCAAVDDCVVQVPECRTAVACEAGSCVFDDIPDGTPLTEQTAGDCAEVVCDGAGKLKVVPAAADVADDGKVCTLDTCTGTTPTHTLKTELPCYAGPAGTSGVGVCRPGLQQCDPLGNPIGGCEGQVIPSSEVCDVTERDDDCDGTVNEEGLDCVCGDGFISEGEECDDGNTSPGDKCSAACELERVTQLVAGGAHTCALLQDGSVKCWGLNSSGQLGQGHTSTLGDEPGEMGSNLPAISVGVGSVASVATGGDFICVLLNVGTVKCWGNNSVGQLGLGDTSPRGDQMGEMGISLPEVDLGYQETAVAITAGIGHACAIMSNGPVRCWGSNYFGQLGLGDTDNRGDDPTETSVSSFHLDLGSQRAVAISSHRFHTCAILEDGSVKCWGDNDRGKLGLGDTNDRGDAPDEMGDNLPAVDLGTGKTATAIAAGRNHTCAILNDGSVKCWGGNSDGALGLGPVPDLGVSPGQMGDNLPAVDLGAGKTATAIAAGYNETCVLLNDNTVKCWGYNHLGKLGLGTTDFYGDSLEDMGDNLPAVSLGAGKTAVGVAVGETHACAILNDGSAKCWGANDRGQLGLGYREPHGDEPNEMGDNLPTIKLFSDAW